MLLYSLNYLIRGSRAECKVYKSGSVKDEERVKGVKEPSQRWLNASQSIYTIVVATPSDVCVCVSDFEMIEGEDISEQYKYICIC